MPEGVRQQMERFGWAVERNAVERAAIAGALRLFHLAIRREGLSSQQVEEWSTSTFFPHLRWEPEIWALLPSCAADVLGEQEGDEWAEPQLVLRFPDLEQPWTVEPHIDRLPPWAEGRSYRGVVGVPLTSAGPADGGLIVWPGSHAGPLGRPLPLDLTPGEALFMHPRLSHTGTLNLGGTIRMVVYFRLLAGT